VYDVLEYLAGGMSEDEILKDFPDLTREDILCARKRPCAPVDAILTPGIGYFHHSLPIIPGSARDGKPRSFLLCLEAQKEPESLFLVPFVFFFVPLVLNGRCAQSRASYPGSHPQRIP
jgi:hypothetical protein